MSRYYTIQAGLLLLLLPWAVQAQLDDPTRPPGHQLATPGGKKKVASDRFWLTAVRISGSQRLAEINDELLEVGDSVNGAKVLAIYPAAVKLQRNGRSFTLRLVTRMKKKPARH